MKSSGVMKLSNVAGYQALFDKIDAGSVTYAEAWKAQVVASLLIAYLSNYLTTIDLLLESPEAMQGLLDGTDDDIIVKKN